MNLGDSNEWEIPKSKIDKKLDNLENILNVILNEVVSYKTQLKLQNEKLKLFENSLNENRIMYVELLKMHKKFHLETRQILEKHKDTISKQLENNNLGYKEIVNILQDNKLALNKIEKLGFENVKELKIILEKIKLNNNRIKSNLSSTLFKQRTDNLFWRSYSNNFVKSPGIISIVDDFTTEDIKVNIKTDKKDPEK